MAATTSLTTPKLQELLSTITIRDNLVNDILTWVLSGHSVIPSPNRACFKIFHGFFFQFLWLLRSCLLCSLGDDGGDVSSVEIVFSGDEREEAEEAEEAWVQTVLDKPGVILGQPVGLPGQLATSSAGLPEV
ncbi:hypothetical protein Tsubulata_026322 [Turnera subulata]|uniref:Uncharacterized protein n=1 Tax=Turnera subulata TaxID=218843 RepID=A0A9Q0JEK2_9ROSI|nr:hypothetical protein Tsubulata_026322 [Turnera subulata]